MGKMTKAQLRMLRAVGDGAVERRFDVYGGYWWEERGKRLPAFGKSEHFPPLPIRYLLQSSLIVLGATEHPHSGYQVAKYSVTPAGRAALEEHNG